MGKNNLDNQDLVVEIINDFKQRQQERKQFESKWQLNLNFFMGNQYCSINGNNEVVDFEKQFFWQEREVFNHIAPIVELRLSKLTKVRPSMTVIPFSDTTNDINCAKVSKNILKATSYKLNLTSIISKATAWSEICGTSFYKVLWNSDVGDVVFKNENGETIREGEVQIEVVSPFEIYPDSASYNALEDVKSIMHVKAFDVDAIKNIWGVDVKGEDIDVYSLDTINNIGGLGYIAHTNTSARKIKHNSALVIEKYESPTVKYPFGRLIIVAGDKLVYVGELPYINANNNERGFPFVRQCSIVNPGSFWGSSVIERCIPIQRSFNAIKNRKHEFLNRLSMGVLAVEDGSVDTDNLEEEGMAPGKVLIYRQGSSIPRLLNSSNVPVDFGYEEDRLQNEFLTVSGVSDLLRSSSISSNLSGTALQLLIEQDEARLISSAEQIREAVKEISKQILRLYKQFITNKKASKLVADNGNIEMFYWNNSDINSDDVVFETENELNESLAQKRTMIFDIYNSGLLNDEQGKISNSTRQKILEQLGFGVWDNSQDVKALQVKRANKENLNLVTTNVINNPVEIDDHNIHINEHICFMLSEDFEKAAKNNSNTESVLLNHIKQHKQFMLLTNQVSKEE